MWFIFPQLRALGRSSTAHRYGLTGLPEAQAYLAQEVLGPRLKECAKTVLGVEDKTATQIFGGIDAMKLRSSMTLFGNAAPEHEEFLQVIEKYFGGEADPLTLDLLRT